MARREFQGVSGSENRITYNPTDAHFHADAGGKAITFSVETFFPAGIGPTQHPAIRIQMIILNPMHYRPGRDILFFKMDTERSNTLTKRTNKCTY